MSRERCTLALAKLDDFAAWAGEHGHARELTRGKHEVLRLRASSTARGLLIWHRRAATHAGAEPVHATSHQTAAQALVRRWLKERDR